MAIQTTVSDTADSDRHTPRVWLVLGDKMGDNGQVYTIRDALDWPVEIKHIKMLDEFVLGKPKVGPTLYHIDREASDPLQPPWPDLIITVGRRPANVALWIRQQSGGHSRIVLVGKPSGMMGQFDLIIASSENRFPPLPNVLPIALPLMRVDQAAVAAAAQQWRERRVHYPKPLIGVMVGGPTGPYAFNQRVVDQLIALATGWDMDLAELLRIGERAVNIKRLINLKLGFTRDDDTLPKRVRRGALQNGGSGGYVPDKDMGPMIAEYYRHRGWSEEGVHTRAKFDDLELSDALGKAYEALLAD